MNEIRIFDNPQFGSIRTTGSSDNPLFCLADVCKVLELHDNVVRQRLDDGVCSKYPISDSLGRMQETNFINEDGLYDVILDSRKPEAKAFRKWVTSEVLPSIRKAGGYIAASREETPEEIMARALRVADETLKRHQVMLQAKDEQIAAQAKEIQELSAMAEYTRDVLQSPSTYTLTQISKDLGFRSVYAFTQWAYNKHVLYKQSDQWLPTARYSSEGYFSTRTYKYVKADNSIGTSITTVITEKGREMLHSLLSSQ